MESPRHHTAQLPVDNVSDVSGKPVNIVKPIVVSGKPVNIVKPVVSDDSECLAAAQNIATTSEIETNGKCPEQLEMMIVKDGVAHAREAKDFAEVLNLGCNCKERSTLRGVVVMVIMLLSNMLNYMDRFTIVGVLKEFQEYYKINNAQVGLMQTAFIVAYMLFSLVFGYVGDRFNRTIVISIGIFGWSAVMLFSSFVGPGHFVIFVLLRAVVGIGEGCYSTIAPTIIADLFADNTRTTAISIFYIAIPVGSGLGYIIGAYAGYLMGSWQWALRVTPVFGVLCVILTIVFVKEPPRGASEGGTNLKTTSWKEDLKYLVKHKSFMLSAAAFTCVSFVTGALALWAPLYIYKSLLVQPVDASDAQVSFIFGIITCLAGFSGVAIGMFAAKRLRPMSPRADPLVCAFGLITGAPFLLLSLVLSRYQTVITWIFIYVGETLVSLNWALVNDILLYVVIPTRRSSALAIQILMAHALGDAGSPYIVGLIADGFLLHFGHKDFVTDYASLQFALYMTCFVCVIGGGFFLATAIYVTDDKNAANLATQGVMMTTDAVDTSDHQVKPPADINSS